MWNESVTLQKNHKNHDNDNDTLSCVYEYICIYISICITSCFVFYKLAGSPFPSKKYLAEEKHYANPIRQTYLTYICTSAPKAGLVVTW